MCECASRMLTYLTRLHVIWMGSLGHTKVEGTNDKVKRPEGSPSRSQGSEGPQTSSDCIMQWLKAGYIQQIFPHHILFSLKNNLHSHAWKILSKVHFFPFLWMWIRVGKEAHTGKKRAQLILVTTATTGGGVLFSSRRTFFLLAKFLFSF